MGKLMENIYSQLVELKDKPEEFNALADTIFEDFIVGVPKERQPRLRAMHWRIQQQLRNYTDPVARLNRFIVIFYDEYFKLMEELQDGFAQILDKKPIQPQTVDSTNVVAFKKPGA